MTEVVNERRVARMVKCVLSDASDLSPFDLMDRTFADATDREFVEAFNRVALMARELLRRDALPIKPKHEPEVRRRRKHGRLPLFDWGKPRRSAR